MDRRKVTVGAAATGVAAGVVGLVLLAMPTGAGAAPTLPPVSAEDLTQSVLTAAAPPAMNGTVEVRNDLGLPPIPGVPQLSNGKTQARIWWDGDGRSRVSLPGNGDEKTWINDKETQWAWDSSSRKAVKVTVDKETLDKHKADIEKRKAEATGNTQTDPAAIAKTVIDYVRSSSKVTVDGTAMVSGRPAYELVLSPKPEERTLLREVRIAVDSETRLPLRLAVQAHGSAEPVLQVGFSELTVGKQDPALFSFTPPAGATVEEKKLTPKLGADQPKEAPKAPLGTGDLGKLPFQIVGEGWDTTVVGRVPATADKTVPPMPGKEGKGGQQLDPLTIAKSLGTPVNGAWGNGWVFSTKVGTALLTSDGKFAAGAVPQQVLIEAIGQVK